MKNKEVNVNRKRIRNSIVACACVAALGVAGISAYFTDNDTKTNTFTIGNVKQELQEPNWNPENAKDITPNQTIKKDPQVKNTGVNDQYVFLTVKVPKANIVTAKDDGTKRIVGETDLFKYTENEGWTLLKTANEADSTTCLYCYGTGTTLTALAKDATTPTLFDSVKFVNAVEGQGLETTTKDIEITSYGIQTSNLGVTTPEDVWNIIKTQNNITTDFQPLA